MHFVPGIHPRRLNFHLPPRALVISSCCRNLWDSPQWFVDLSTWHCGWTSQARGWRSWCSAGGGYICARHCTSHTQTCGQPWGRGHSSLVGLHTCRGALQREGAVTDGSVRTAPRVPSSCRGDRHCFQPSVTPLINIISRITSKELKITWNS